MARKPLGYRSRFARRSESRVFTAPIGGLNARDVKSAMPEIDAYELTNYFPDTDGVVTRLGCADHATGMPATVKTIAVHEGGSSATMLAFSGGSIYVTSTPGAVGAAIKTGRTEDYCSTTMFSNAGAQFLIGCNGADEPFRYDGSTYAGLVITGVTGSQNNLVWVYPFNVRLFFAAINQLGFYYLASAAIQGAASYFDLAQVFTMGGYLLSIGSISRDGGSGTDDLAVFVSSRGEVAVYEGTDPSSSTAWSKVGVYRIPKPIGRRCLFKYGGDLIVITEQGLVPLSGVMAGEVFDPNKNALSSKLGSALRANNAYKDAKGWEAVLHSEQTMLIFNVPTNVGGTTFNQYVMNTITMAWAKFEGWDAYCWAEYNGSVYYGTAAGTVVKANTGYTDNGADIVCDGKAAYNYYASSESKHWHDARIMAEFSGLPAVSAGFGVDYYDNDPNSVGVPVETGSEWDISTWDVSPWGSATTIQRFWLTIDKDGFAGSLWLRTTVSGENLKWISHEIMYEKGGLI